MPELRSTPQANQMADVKLSDSSSFMLSTLDLQKWPAISNVLDHFVEADLKEQFKVLRHIAVVTKY